MLLAIDVGNTEITVGVFAGDELVGHWRITTGTSRTSDEWMFTIESYLGLAGHATKHIKAVLIGSVAPGVTQPLTHGVSRAVGVEPVEIGPHSDLPITLAVDEPRTVGADRVINTLAAMELYRRDTIVADFGTATTFDCITGDGRFLGGVIGPGLQTAAELLTRRTAKLPATDLVPPERVIGTRTEDCIKAGVVFGAVDAADGIVRRIKREWPGDAVPYVVATGGLAPLVAGLSTEIEATEPHLTLLGLRFAARHLGVGD